jgi:enamine deaminase RidA (YjgF/YER057c/UK114 family)
MKFVTILIATLFCITFAIRKFNIPEYPTSPNFSHGVISHGILYTCGVVAAQTGNGTTPHGITAESKVIFRNLENIMHHVGTKKENVIVANIHMSVPLTDENFRLLNTEYQAFFQGTLPPARTTIGGVSLGKWIVEIGFVVEL